MQVCILPKNSDSIFNFVMFVDPSELKMLAIYRILQANEQFVSSKAAAQNFLKYGR